MLGDKLSYSDKDETRNILLAWRVDQLRDLFGLQVTSFNT